MFWQCGNYRLDLSQRPLLMGILNVTPDSFSDGYPDKPRALDQAQRLIDAGADILDVGGESTRPGSESVAEQAEMARVLPIIEALASRCNVPISIDTQKPAVAAAAIKAGASIINHVSGSLDYGDMLPVLQQSHAGYVAMHMLSRPKTMQRNARYDDVVQEVAAALAVVASAAKDAHIAADRLLFDPGIGFGKRLEHNLALLRDLPRLVQHLQRPLLLGISRKSWLDKLLDVPMQPIDERDAYTAIASIMAPFPTVVVHRVHRVAWVRKAFKLKNALSVNGDQRG